MAPVMPKPLVDLLISPWAIEPQRLLELQALYAAHVRGEVPDIAAIEARLGRPLASEQQTYTVNASGVARLEVQGVMAPKANLLMQISGGVSTQMFTQQLQSMRADGRVKSVMLVWDSPGGNVLGIPAAAAALRALAAEKATVSFVRGVMASAAYWVGSASNAIYIEGQTDVLGSLGVYQRISWDQPAPNTLDLVRGRYKRASLNGQPPSAEFLAGAEQQLDYLYSVLIDAVAEHRGVDAETVERDMADGRIFTGRLAIDAGLADGMRTEDELMEQLAAEPAAFSRRRRSGSATATALLPREEAGPFTTEKGAVMTPQEQAQAFRAEHPEAAAVLLQQGADAERGRIQAVRDQSLAGHEQLIEALMWDGKTTGEQAAVAVLKAERQLGTERLANLQADRPAPLPADATATGESQPPAATDKTAAPLDEAREMAAEIDRRVAEARAQGRTLNPLAALAAMKKEKANA
jgi:ClpP class serine protease